MPARDRLWPDPRVKPPAGAVEIDWGHPLSTSLFDCVPFNQGGGVPRNLTTDSDLALASSPSWSAIANSIGGSVVGGSSFNLPDHGNMVAGDFAIQVSFVATSYGGPYTTLFEKADGGGREVAAFINSGSTAVQYLAFGGTEMDAINLGSFPVNVPNQLTVSRAGSTVSVYANGVLAGTKTLGGTAAHPVNPLNLGGAPSGNATMTGAYLLFNSWRRALSASEVAQLAAEPYAFLRPVVRRSYSIAAAAPSATPAAARESYRRPRILVV